MEQTGKGTGPLHTPQSDRAHGLEKGTRADTNEERREGI
jgi:hypothetical protein